MEKLRNEELGIGDWLSMTSHHFGKNIKVILQFVLIFNILLPLVLYFTPYRLGLDASAVKYYLMIYGMGYLVKAIAFAIITGFVGIIATLGLAITIEESVLGREITFREALSRALSTLVDSWVTSLLMGLIIVGLTLLLIIPGIIGAVYYAFVLQVVVLRQVKYKKALNYSKELVRGKWGKVFGYMLLIIVIGFALGLVLGILALPLDILGLEGLGGIITEILSKVYGGYSVVATTILFLNLDYLKYGFDQEPELIQ